MDSYAFREMSRGSQVLADVGRRRPTVWLALDDVDEGWGTERENLVVTDLVRGIEEPAVLERLRTALMRFA
jgi:hypothetical protein